MAQEIARTVEVQAKSLVLKQMQIATVAGVQGFVLDVVVVDGYDRGRLAEIKAAVDTYPRYFTDGAPNRSIDPGLKEMYLSATEYAE